MGKGKQSGFTLLEIMVAFTILAIASGAWLKVLHSSTQTISIVEQRKMAHWVARNQLNLSLLEERERFGVVQRGPYLFEWQISITETGTKSFQRLDISVSEQDKSQTLAELTGYKYAR